MITPETRRVAVLGCATAALAAAVIWAGALLVFTADEAADLGRAAAGVAFALIAAYACLRASRTSADDARAWRLMAAGLVAFSLSAVVFAGAGTFDLPARWLTVAALLGLVFRLLVALALVSFPLPPATLRSKWRARLDLVVVATTVAYLAWGLILSDQFHAARDSPVAARAAMFSLLDIVLVIIALMTSLRRPAGERDSSLLVGVGLLFLAVTDWNVGSATSADATDPSTFAALCSLAALACITTGAWLTVQPAGSVRRIVVNQRCCDLFPVVLASTALLFTVAGRHEWSADPVLLLLAVGSATSLLAWQLAVVLENEEMVRSLGEHADRFRTLVETAPIAITVTSSDGRVEIANSEAERLLSARSGDLVGERLSVREVEPKPGDRSLRSRVLAGETIRDCRVPLRRGDGTTLDMLVSAAPLPARSGEVESVVWIGSDDGPRLRGLAAMIDVQRMRAFEQFTSGIAHDFNNRLTVILGMTEVLLAETTSDADKELLTAILTAGKRAAGLVDDLVGITRRKFDEQERLDVRTLLGRLEPDLRRLAPQGATLVIETSDTTLPVQADWSDLEQAITNLVLNAYEAMPEGGTVTVRAGRDTVRTHDDRPMVELVVADDGEGMTAEVRARIFEPFFSTRTATGRSRGLGLPAVQGVVIRSHGELTVDAAPGAGSSVTVRLPLRERDPAVTPTDHPRAAEGLVRAATILLVDDEADVRAVTRRALTTAGHQVVEAADVDEALSVLASAPEIDLLLSDVVMPGRSGIDLAHEFAALRPRRPILLLSGFVGDTPEGGMAADVPFPLLSKPISHGDLVAAVAEALQTPS